MTRRARSLTLCACLAGLPALAQTSASWVATSDGSWSSTFNWSGGGFPDGGGTATFGAAPAINEFVVVTCDLSNVTVASMVFNSGHRFFVNAPGIGSPNTLTIVGSGNLHVASSQVSAPSMLSNGHAINVTVTGSAGLTKTGAGVVMLGGTNAYSSGTRVLGGVLGSTSGDAAFGFGSIELNGGTMRCDIASMSGARDFLLSGAGTIEAFSPFGTSGVISGSGNFNKTGNNLAVLSGANTYSGSTIVHTGTLVLAGNGSILNSPAILGSSTLTIDNASTNLTDRIADATPVTLRGSGLSVGGHATLTSSETFGATTLDGGFTFVTIVPGAGSGASVTSASLSRASRGTVFFRGNSLGSAPGANVANVYYLTAPTLVGGAGVPGSTSISIIPGAWGINSSTGNSNSTTASFVTYGPNGVRPLNTTTEYVTSIVPSVTSNNVRLSSTITLNSGATINALLCTTGGNLNGAGTLTVTSGMVLTLNSPASISNPLQFGTSEAVLATAGLTTYSGKISGSGGLTKTGIGGATLSNATSDYTGQTTIVCGNINLMSSVVAGAPGPLGSDSSAIVLAPGSNFSGTARLWSGASGTITISRDLLATGNPAGTPGLGTSGLLPNQQLVMNGTITIDTNLQLQNGPLADGPAMIFNGRITGVGRLHDNFGSAQIINGDNDYSGGTEIRDGSYALGSNTALGTGTIWFLGSGAILASGTSRTIANPIAVMSPPVIGGSNNLTLTGAMDLAGQTLTHLINNSATTTYAGVISNGGLTKAGPGTLVLASTNSYGGATAVSAGTLVFGASQNLSSLTVASGSTARVTAGANKLLHTRSLSVTGGSTLDLTDADMIIDYSGISPLPAVQSLLTSGYAVGSWTGTGITSSVAAASPASFKTAIGFAEATDLYSTFPALFVGRPVDATSILLRYTVAGDANLDGTVSGADFNILAGNFGASSSMRWSLGDFTFDGAVNSADFNVLAGGFGLTVASSPDGIVPEPALGVVAPLTLLLASRQRRSRTRVD